MVRRLSCDDQNDGVTGKVTSVERNRMNRLSGLIALGITLSLVTGTAGANEMVSEKRAVDASVLKVKVGGLVDLRVQQGATPSLILTGDKDELAKVTTEQRGDELQIDMQRGVRLQTKKPPVRAELILPTLNELDSSGVGASEVTGFSGRQLVLALDGAGSMTVRSQYGLLHATLHGVGNMTLDGGEMERVVLGLGGTGRVRITGSTRQLKADVSGVGNLEAQDLQAEAVELNLSGVGSAKVYAGRAAAVTSSGLGSATVYGNPAARSTASHGAGSIVWK